MTMTTNISQSTARGGVTKKEGATTMTPHDAAPQAAPSKPGSKPDAKDDLKSLPLAEVEKQLGSSPDGLTQAEAVCTENLARNGDEVRFSNRPIYCFQSAGRLRNWRVRQEVTEPSLKQSSSLQHGVILETHKFRGHRRAGHNPRRPRPLKAARLRHRNALRAKQPIPATRSHPCAVPPPSSRRPDRHSDRSPSCVRIATGFVAALAAIFFETAIRSTQLG